MGRGGCMVVRQFPRGVCPVLGLLRAELDAVDTLALLPARLPRGTPTQFTRHQFAHAFHHRNRGPGVQEQSASAARKNILHRSPELNRNPRHALRQLCESSLPPPVMVNRPELSIMYGVVAIDGVVARKPGR